MNIQDIKDKNVLIDSRVYNYNIYACLNKCIEYNEICYMLSVDKFNKICKLYNKKICHYLNEKEIEKNISFYFKENTTRQATDYDAYFCGKYTRHKNWFSFILISIKNNFPKFLQSTFESD